MAKNKTLIWRGNAADANRQPLLIEGICTSAGVLPGTLVKVVATGLATSDVAATVNGTKLLLANRDVMRQKNIDEAWTQNDSMQAVELRSGEFAVARVAAGQNITARRTPLASNGDGTLKIATPATDYIVAYSDEIINTGASVALVEIYKD